VREDDSARLVALRGQVVTDYEVWPEGTILFEGGSIAEVSPDDSLLGDAEEVHEHPDSLLLPGFVDLQVNGAFGVDVATEPSRLGELSQALLSTGTTAYLPTIISSPASLYEQALPELAAAVGGPASGAEVLGVHLEGPFINLDRRGAHAAAHIVAPDPRLLARLLDIGPVRMLTLAPELEEAGEIMALALGRGVVVSAGHSGATFEVAYEALDASVAGVTHLFNAMSAMHHREPGLPGAAFAHPRVVCGLIADGLHVHPELVALAFRMLGPDRVCLVTDAIAAAGMGDGEYRLATRTVYLDGGVPERPGVHELHPPRGRPDGLDYPRASRRGGQAQGPHNPRLRRRRGGARPRSLGRSRLAWRRGGLRQGREQPVRRTVRGVRVECVQGDITAQEDVAAIVNAANAELRSGGGVAGAIHRAAGPGLAREARQLAPISPGEAVITGAHDLPNRYVIHTLGPVYGQDRPEAELLANCYRNSLALAEEKGLDSVAFPAISTGIFGYPVEEAARVALGTVVEEAERLESVRLIRFVLFGEKDLEVHERVLSETEGR
jgi:N-acetylglucosamine-6-phosphate deacetylase